MLESKAPATQPYGRPWINSVQELQELKVLLIFILLFLFLLFPLQAKPIELFV